MAVVQPRRGSSNFIRNTGFGPKGKFRMSEFGLSEKPVDSPRIAAKQIEELWPQSVILQTGTDLLPRRHYSCAPCSSRIKLTSDLSYTHLRLQPSVMHMATAVSGVPPVSTRPTILDRLSVPPQLACAYL